jgi:cell division protein ZapA
MAGKKHRYKAKIGNRTFTIIGNQDDLHMSLVEDILNEQLELIKEKSPGIDDESAAILLAVNAVSQQVLMQEKLETDDENNNETN